MPIAADIYVQNHATFKATPIEETSILSNLLIPSGGEHPCQPLEPEKLTH